MAKGRYAIVVSVRKQVNNFTDNLDSFSGIGDILLAIDLIDHPQKNEVQIDWFYDPETNMFSPEGEIHYPEPELLLVQPLTFEQAQALEAANNIDYLVCLKDLGL